MPSQQQTWKNHSWSAAKIISNGSGTKFRLLGRVRRRDSPDESHHRACCLLTSARTNGETNFRSVFDDFHIRIFSWGKITFHRIVVRMVTQKIHGTNTHTNWQTDTAFTLSSLFFSGRRERVRECVCPHTEGRKRASGRERAERRTGESGATTKGESVRSGMNRRKKDCVLDLYVYLPF
jgi:hypothetical protein